MATLFKPTRPYPLPPDAEVIEKDGRAHARVREKGKAVHYPLSADGAAYLKPAAKWAADVRFADGRRKRVRFSPNRDASAVMLAELLKRIENERAGIVDRTTTHRKRPLAGHLDDWQASLRANGRGRAYIDQKVGRVRAVLDGCGWVFPGDMAADRLESYLADLRSRRPELPPIPDATEWFTLADLCRLSGDVTRQSVAAQLRRHRLPARGNGRARRYPRETVLALRQHKDRGAAAGTTNDWLQAVRQFARWLVDNDRLNRSPFARLKPLNAKLDQRRRRGELSPAELGALFATTARSVKVVRGLDGADRVMLYRTAVGTGFRAAELAALVPDWFDLDATPPAVVLPPEFSKNRKGAVQPLPAELVTDLRIYLGLRPGKQPVWPGTWADRSAEVLRADLDAAGIPVEVDGPEGTETRDFHALRAVYISNVIRAGADLKQAMTLARHSDPKLTAGRYARTRLHDLGAVVDRLPSATSPSVDPVPGILRMTGTDALPIGQEQQGAATGAAAGGSRRGRLRVAELGWCRFGRVLAVAWRC